MVVPPGVHLQLPSDVVIAMIGTIGVFITTIGGVMVEMLRRQTKHVRRITNITSSTNEQVRNSHTTNLRDDVDRVLHGIDSLKESGMENALKIMAAQVSIEGLTEAMLCERVERQVGDARISDQLTAITSDRGDNK